MSYDGSRRQFELKPQAQLLEPVRCLGGVFQAEFAPKPWTLQAHPTLNPQPSTLNPKP